MSKQKGKQPKRYPEVEARLRPWLADQYRRRGITGPWAIVSRKVASEMGAYHGTVGSALAQFARMPDEGVVMISPGNYEYMPPRRPPTPAMLAGRTVAMPAAPVKEAAPAAPERPKPKRTLDMTLRPKLIQHARDVWKEKGEITIVTARSVAKVLGTKETSTGAALLVLSKEFPEVGYVKIGGGVYEIHRPRRRRPQASEPEFVDEPDAEEAPEPQEPEVPEPAQPAPQPGPAPEPYGEPQPGPQPQVIAVDVGGRRMHVLNGPEPATTPEELDQWRTMRTGDKHAVLENVLDGSIWHATKLELS